MVDSNEWAGMSPEWVARLSRVRSAVAGWSSRLVDPDEPAAGSSLAKDDTAYPAMPCSQLAWWGMSVGVEHLDATVRLLDQQVEAGGPLLPAANFTLLRAGLVGACQAAVLLLPKTREERIVHGLQLAHEEYRQVVNFREHTLSHRGLVGEARRNADRRDFLSRYKGLRDTTKAMLSARGASTLTDTAMTERAGQLVHESGTDAALLQMGVETAWRLGSGASHGRLLMGMHQPGGHVVEERTALFGASFDVIGQEIGSVSLILSESWRVWDTRRQRHI